MLVIPPLVAVSLSFLQFVPSAQANTSAICSTTFTGSHTTPSSSHSNINGTLTQSDPHGPPLPTATDACGNPISITSTPITTSSTIVTTSRNVSITSTRPNVTTSLVSTTIQTSTVPVVTTTPTTQLVNSTTSVAQTSSSTSPAASPSASDISGGADDSSNIDPPPSPTGGASALSVGKTGALFGVISVGMFFAHIL